MSFSSVQKTQQYIVATRRVKYHSIVGSVVECSPATRAARVRFPDDANLFIVHIDSELNFMN